MVLSELRELVATLRQLGVTKYECGEVKVELGEVPAVAPAVDLTREGFRPSARDPRLQEALDRLPSVYSDPFLFDVK